MSDFSLYAAQEQRRGYLEQTRENSGRLARTHGTWRSTGSGELIVPEAFSFGVTFVEEPSVAYGYSLPEVDGQAQLLTAGSVPRCGGGVYRWVRDRRGFYTGCNVAFTVDFGYGGVPKTYEVVHSMVFEALALKDLPRGIIEGLGVNPGEPV